MSQLKENIGSIHIELSKQIQQEIAEVHTMIINPADKRVQITLLKIQKEILLVVIID